MTGALLRHTRVNAAPGTCYGWLDVPLAETFAAEAAEVAARLPWRPDAVWTSPAERCLRLAETLAGGAPVRVDARLRELHFGAWEGRTWDALRSPASEAWALDPWRGRPPGGESGEEFWARVAAARAEFLAEPGARGLVVTHGGVIRAWRALAAGRTWRDSWAEPVGFGARFEAG